MGNQDETVAARRKALAEAMRLGEPVMVTPSGTVELQQEAEESGEVAIVVPSGKLA